MPIAASQQVDGSPAADGLGARSRGSLILVRSPTGRSRLGVHIGDDPPNLHFSSEIDSPPRLSLRDEASGRRGRKRSVSCSTA
jgi:hypothetical protein